MEAIKPTGKIIRGSGALSNFLQEIIRTEDFDSICLITTFGMLKRNHHLQLLSGKLSSERMILVSPNPELSDLEKQIEKLRHVECAHLVAVGGGSVLDSAKILAFMLRSPRTISLQGALTGNEENRIYSEERIKLSLVPTTSGTGAEITPFATVWDSMNSQKFSLDGLYHLVDTIVFDPLLLTSAPKEASLFFALDTISHSLESLWNKNKTKESQVNALLALKLSLEVLPVILKDLKNLRAREQMQQASFLAGKAIAQTKTALAHSISYPLSLRYKVPHGLACSFTLISIYNHLRSVPELEGNGFDKKEIKEAICFLQTLELAKKISTYCSKQQAVSLLDEMINPSRAGNFILGKEVPLKNIIETSFE